MKSLIILLAGLICSNLLKAQESFLVYSVKGAVTITENDKTSKAKIGSLLGPAVPRLHCLPMPPLLLFAIKPGFLHWIKAANMHWQIIKTNAKTNPLPYRAIT